MTSLSVKKLYPYLYIGEAEWEFNGLGAGDKVCDCNRQHQLFI